METTEILRMAFRLLGSLALLMFGMKLMSETLQKMAGPGLRHLLGRMTKNRGMGVLTGMVVTATVQSSTATTVMTVSFVNAGLLTLAQAISVIMGANIGTTLTAWIMSAGFAFNITSLVWPAFVVAMFLIYRKAHENMGDFLFGIAFMFLGLGTLRQTGTDMNLGENPAVLAFFASFDSQAFSTTIIFLLIGGVLTMCCQSSAAVMAITMILCSSGALPIYQGIALVMGENIGTTVTSNLAAMTASTQARRAALAHMFFNIFGVLWILPVFHPFVDGVCKMVGYDPTRLSIVLAAFHTCFNVLNTAILIGFIPQIERFVCWVIRDKEESSSDAEPLRLQYIAGGLMQTPEISVLQAQREINAFAERAGRMFGTVRTLMDETDEEAFEKALESLGKTEDICDQTELEIANYLEEVGTAHLSDDTKAKVRAMMREIGEIESICDACYKLGRTIRRLRESGQTFTDDRRETLDRMFALTGEALEQMMRVLQGRRKDQSTEETFRIENEINALRRQLLAENIEAVNGHRYDYGIGTIYADLVVECERLGDYVVNVVEAKFWK